MLGVGDTAENFMFKITAFLEPLLIVVGKVGKINTFILCVVGKYSGGKIKQIKWDKKRQTWEKYHCDEMTFEQI